MALLYAVQAATGNPGLAYVPVAAYLTNQLGFSAAQLAGFQATVLLPWVTKPLWALLVDRWAGRGDRTKGCLALCFSWIVAGFGLLSLVTQPTVGWLLAGLSLLSVAVAVSDVLADRWMVVEGQRHQRENLYQAAQWVGWGFTAVAMFLVGGWLADHIPLHQVFGLSTLIPGVALLLVVGKLPETSGDRPRQQASWRRLRNALGQADLRRVLGLVVLLHSF
ncbi:MAG: MFS transporter [Nodosilinea sp.]